MMVDHIVETSSIEVALEMCDYLIKEATILSYYQEAGGVVNPTNNANAQQGNFFDRVKKTISGLFDKVVNFIAGQGSKQKERQLENLIDDTIQNDPNVQGNAVQPQPQAQQADVQRPQPVDVSPKMQEWLNNVDFTKISNFKWPDQAERIKQMLLEFSKSRMIVTCFTDSYIRSLNEISQTCNKTSADLMTLGQNASQRLQNVTDQNELIKGRENLMFTIGSMLDKFRQVIGHYYKSIGTETAVLDPRDYKANADQIQEVTASTSEVLKRLQEGMNNSLAIYNNQTDEERTLNGAGNLSQNPELNPIEMIKKCLATAKEVTSVIMKFDQIRDADIWAINKYREIWNFQQQQAMQNQQQMPSENNENQ